MEPNRHRNGSPIDRKLSYGQEQVVGSRSQRLTARFLNGRPVGVVWCQFKSQSGNWKSTGWLINARGSDWKLRPSRVNGVHVQSTPAGLGHEGGMATDQADVTSLGWYYHDWLWLSSIIESFEKWCCWWIVLSLTMATWKPTNRRSNTPGTGGVQQAKNSSHLIREKVMIMMRNSVKRHKMGNSSRESNSNRLIIINLKIARSL